MGQADGGLTGVDAPVAVVVCADDGAVVATNRDADRWLGGRTGLLDRFEPDDRARVRAHLEHAASTPPTSRTHLVVGGFQLTSAMGADGIHVAVAEVADLVAEVEELRLATVTDPLTGLANRTLFMDHLRRALADRTRHDRAVALLFCDLDDFKTVNDTWGHGVGDEVLIEVARHIENAVRPADIVARVGGDEFVVLIDHTDLPEALVVADRILAVGHQPVVTSAPDAITVTVSVGVAVEHDTVRDRDFLVRADSAMYAAKARGRACRVVHGDHLDEWFVNGTVARDPLVAAHLELRERFEQLTRDARIDQRTGLDDDAQFAQDLAAAHVAGAAYGLLFIDIDWFHDFNERYLHTTGHRVLAHVGTAAAQVLADAGTLYRYGGEEFVAIVPGASSVAALLDRAEHVRAAVEALDLEHSGSEYGVVTVSVGVAVADLGDPDPEAVVRAADAAMFTAKRAGRNRVHG